MSSVKEGLGILGLIASCAWLAIKDAFATFYQSLVALFFMLAVLLRPTCPST